MTRYPFIRKMWSIIGIVISLYIGLAVVLFFFQAHFIYFPTRAMAVRPTLIGLDYEDIRFETTDGVSLSGWYVPVEESKKIVLFFHGNAGNISHRLESIALFHKLGFNVFIIDYRGYGQSQGRISEQGTYLDAEAAWHYLVEERHIEPENIIFFGRSLGGAVATWLAQNHPPKALILESTFTSVPDMGARQFPFLPVRLLARIKYNTLERLPRVKSPILIVHSPDDELIPYSHGRQLFQAAPEPKDFLELRGGHNEGFIISGPGYHDGLKAFIRKHTGG
jgi:fermentation-respiration switch protein FrsA (DUF1100 family)